MKGKNKNKGHNNEKKHKIKEYYDFSSDEILEIKDLQKIFAISKTKSKSYDASFSNNIIVKEFFLSLAPKQEDSYYAHYPIFLQNIRRGNSIIEFLGENGVKSERFLCRRGLMKFYDLQLSFLQSGKRFSKKLDNDEKLIRDLIFAEIISALKENKQVLVYKTVKENGTNVQVSYIEKCEAWLVASKNNSILIRSEEDIETYDRSEFNLVKIIAFEWMKILKKMNVETLNLLKKEANGLTLVGEMIGFDKETAKLLKYHSQELKFITLVENSSKNTCVLPSKAIEFFQKFNLKSVKTEMFLCANTEDYLFEELKVLHEDISLMSLDKGGEGVVLYFVIQDPLKPLEDRVTSLCKIKTLEYRIFRKIREKLKKIRNFDKFPKNLFKILEKEALRLCESCECENKINLDFYLDVGEEFFYQLTENYTKANFKKAVNQFNEYIQKVIFNVRNSLKNNIFEEKELVLLISPPLYLTEEMEKRIKKEFAHHELLKEFDKKNVLSNKKHKFIALLNKLDKDLEKIIEIFDKTMVFLCGVEESSLQRLKLAQEINFNDISNKESFLNSLSLLLNCHLFDFHDILLDGENGFSSLVKQMKDSYNTVNKIPEKTKLTDKSKIKNSSDESEEIISEEEEEEEKKK